MGFLDKRNTAKRTEGVRAPLTCPEGTSAAERVLMTDRVVRAAAALLGISRQRSTTLRGHSNKIVAAIGIGEIASTVWFERQGMTTWWLALGAASSTGIFLDWAIRADLTASVAGDVVTVSTPVRLTQNGALEKGALHDETRQLILNGAVGTMPPEDGLVAVSARGLRRWIFDPTLSFRADPPEPWTGRFRIRARMSHEEASTRLLLIQERCTEATQTSWSFALGIEGFAGAVGAIRCDSVEPGILVGEVDFKPSGDSIPDRVALHKAKSFAEEVLGALKLWGGDAEMAGKSAGASA
jgi:hypothetical protein